MTKRVLLDGNLLEKFKAVFGQDVDQNNFYIMQVKALSSEPISKPGSIYDGATDSPELLREIADHINNPENNVSMHLMHDTQAISIGRWFAADFVYDSDKSYVLAYGAMLENEENKSYIDKIENSILDEVSVNFIPKQAKCSECGFDYLGDDADIENFIDRTCPNGHVIGKDGVHLENSGLEAFYEISLVNQGAAKRAKILPQKGKFDSENLLRLAASGFNQSMLLCSFNNKMEKEMDKETEAKLAQLEANVAELEEKLSEAEKAKEDLEQQVKDIEAAKSESDKAKEDAEQAKADAEQAKADAEQAKADAEAKVEKVKEEAEAEKEEADKRVEATMAFLKKEVKKVLIASGSEEVEVPEDLDGISKLLEDKQAILASLIPAGGVADGALKSKAKDKISAKLAADRLSAFQVN